MLNSLNTGTALLPKHQRKPYAVLFVLIYCMFWCVCVFVCVCVCVCVFVHVCIRACVHVQALASIVHSPLAQDQLIAAAKMVAEAVEKVVGNCSQATDDDKLMAPVSTAGTDVTDAVNALLNKVREGPATAVRGRHDEACDAVLAAIERLKSAQGNPAEMVKQVRVLPPLQIVAISLLIVWSLSCGVDCLLSVIVYVLGMVMWALCQLHRYFIVSTLHCCCCFP